MEGWLPGMHRFDACLSENPKEYPILKYVSHAPSSAVAPSQRYASVRVHSRFALFLAALLLLGLFATPASRAQDSEWNSDVRLGGCGGVYFLAEPGEFWVEIEKADRNFSGRETHLRAIFFGPDREVIAEEYIPDDGWDKRSGLGPVQRVRFSTTVKQKGVYGVNITATADRYGRDIVWGFTSNGSKYLVETSRGHKDERHQEPLVLYNPVASGDVVFLPREDAFEIDLSHLPAGETPIQLFDARDRLVAEAKPGEDGTASFEVAADHPRDATPWRLHLPAYRGTVEIDGVTRWGGADGRYKDLSLWTPDPDSWFDFHANRWLLTPYRQRRNVAPGAEGTVDFEVHNSGRTPKEVTLSLAFPGEAWSCELPADTVSLDPGASETVTLAYRAPDGGDARAQLRATSGDFSTYSTLVLTPDAGVLDKPLDMPIVLEPYRHEDAQFGYAPAYPVTSQVYFDHENRPAITRDASVSVFRDGAWQETGLGSVHNTKIGVDPDNDLYALGNTKGGRALLHSRDGGATFTSYDIPGKARVDLEQFSGHNAPAGPPPLARFTLTSRDPNLKWRRTYDLDLFLPSKNEDGTITIGEPVRLTDQCIGFSSHSGIPSSIVSRGDKVHVAWGEATDPEKDVPGVPTYVATWDRTAQTLSEPALVGYGPPANDVHNTPSITMDSEGYLHVLVGTHGRAFLYARSLEPNDAGGGWTGPEPLGADLRQTYVGFVCDRNDTLHVVFRLWNQHGDYFPASLYASLSYMRKEPGKSWTEPVPLIVSAFSEYSVFYHRLTIDREGALFLSYDYWSTFWFYRTDRRETRRALMTSPDGGDTWKLATMEDLRP